jgi:Tfp pilus assembly protein FimT
MKRGMEWTPIYLLVIIAIAAILLFAIAKPMFQQAAQYAQANAPFLFF